MKKFKWWWGIGAVIIAMLIVSMVRSCRIEDNYSKLKGTYEEYRRIVEADAKIEDALIAKQLATIAELDKKIDSSQQVIADYKKLITLKNTHLADLSEDLGKARTDAERVPILTAMVDTWVEKYGVLEGVVVEKDKQIADWGRKYAAQVEISDAWKSKYEAEHTLRLSGETLNKVLEGKYRRARVTSAVKKVALIALAGVATYQFVKGK
jgi:hypothetical protein